MRSDLKHLIMRRMREDYDDNSEHGPREDFYDERRTGRNRRHRNDMHSHYYENDYADDDDEYDKPLRLSKKVKQQWINRMSDKNGNKGARFTKEEVMSIADKMNIDYDDYIPSDLYVVANMLYCDCTSFRPLMSKDKEPYYYVAAAKEWLEDVDSGLTGSEKLLSYYYNIVNG